MPTARADRTQSSPDRRVARRRDRSEQACRRRAATSGTPRAIASPDCPTTASPSDVPAAAVPSPAPPPPSPTSSRYGRTLGAVPDGAGSRGRRTRLRRRDAAHPPTRRGRGLVTATTSRRASPLRCETRLLPDAERLDGRRRGRGRWARAGRPSYCRTRSAPQPDRTSGHNDLIRGHLRAAGFGVPPATADSGLRGHIPSSEGPCLRQRPGSPATVRPGCECLWSQCE